MLVRFKMDVRAALAAIASGSRRAVVVALIHFLSGQVAWGRDALDFSVSWSAPDQVVVPMKLRNDVPTVACLVNGREVWMILDTGSQRCLLEAGVAREAGVRLLEHSVVKVELSGAKGKETASVGVPRSMAVGAWEWHGLPCAVRSQRTLPAGAKSGGIFKPQISFNILGMDALQAMCSYFTIDYPRREVVFGFRKRFQPTDPNASRQPFEMRDGVLLVKASHEGREWASLLDTGASSEMEINQAIVEQLGPKKPARWIDALHFGLGDGASGKGQRFVCVKLHTVGCLGRDWRNVDAMLVENEPKIGSGICKAHRLTVDFAGGQVWVEVPSRRAR